MSPDAVKAARKALGMTQEQFAEAIGLVGLNRKDTVRSWESGARPCGGPTALAIRYLQKFGPLDTKKTGGD